MTRMIAQLGLKNYRIPIIAAVLALLCGCVSPGHSNAPVATRSTTTPSKAPNPRPERTVTIGEEAARIALDQLGVPYRYGGNNRSGFDCSGLVQYSYAGAGKSVPRTTGQLWHDTTPTSRQNLRVGDLLFFSFEGKMSHVGMYIGDQSFVHAPSSGKTVSVASLKSPYYSKALVRAGRPD